MYLKHQLEKAKKEKETYLERLVFLEKDRDFFKDKACSLLDERDSMNNRFEIIRKQLNETDKEDKLPKYVNLKKENEI